MDEPKTDEKPKTIKLVTRDYIYGAVMVVGFGLIMDGISKGQGWNLPDFVVTAIGAALGVAATFALAWQRNK